jgi:hypothetical protein
MIKDVFPNMRVDRAERIIEQIHIGVIVHSTREADTLFLTAT